MHFSLYCSTSHSAGQRWGFGGHLPKGLSQGVGLSTIAQLHTVWSIKYACVQYIARAILMHMLDSPAFWKELEPHVVWVFGGDSCII